MLQTELFEGMKDLLRNYERMLAFLERQRLIYPDGSLHIKRQDEDVYYARRIIKADNYEEYPISERTRDGLHLIREMRKKRTALHGIPLLRKNVAALQAALKKLSVYEPAYLSDALGTLSQIAPLPDSFFLPGQLNIEKWIADTKAGNYRINPYKPEKRRFPTADGHMTRSKSEGSWCDILAAESLLYRYECGLRLASGRMAYPDFTILHPFERQLIIIEHFGRMDDPQYAIDQLYKLEDYAASGWTLGRDLFFTVETKDRPLTRDRIYEVLYRSGLLQALA